MPVGGGASFGAAKMLADKGVTVLVGGKMGSNMIGALKERGIRTHEMSGLVKEAMEILC